jgi:hypothetical protein
VRRWMERQLTPAQRRALGAALRHVLTVHGIGVCSSRYGRNLGGGLFEFRLDEDEGQVLRKWDPESPGARPGGVGERVLLRVFCHAAGDQIILLLGGYDKGRDPSRRRQQHEIALARQRLDELRRWRPSKAHPDA